MKINKLTITGADNKVGITDLVELVKAADIAEKVSRFI